MKIKLLVWKKTKDPRRVEAGRRLGTNSKYYKAEKKERLRERNEVESERNDEENVPSETMFIIGFLTVIVLGGVYLAKKPSSPQQVETTTNNPKSEPTQKTFQGFD